MEELDEAILQMLAKGAPGPDDIPPMFLKALGPRARQELLDIFILSFSTGKSPQICMTRKPENYQDAYLHKDQSV